ncbi:hypothetical protein ACFQXA_38860 [Nocardiopsis composta]
MTVIRTTAHGLARALGAADAHRAGHRDLDLDAVRLEITPGALLAIGTDRYTLAAAAEGSVMAHLPRTIYALQCDAPRCHAILRDTLGDELLVWGLDLSRDETQWASEEGWLTTPTRRAYCPTTPPRSSTSRSSRPPWTSWAPTRSPDSTCPADRPAPVPPRPSCGAVRPPGPTPDAAPARTEESGAGGGPMRF